MHRYGWRDVPQAKIEEFPPDSEGLASWLDGLNSRVLTHS